MKFEGDEIMSDSSYSSYTIVVEEESSDSSLEDFIGEKSGEIISN